MKKLFVFGLLMMAFCLCFPQMGKEVVKKNVQEQSGKDANTTIVSAPDYANLYYWAAHPAKHDYSDSIPAFLKGEKRDTSVDVFFLYPTTFTANAASAPINADVNDEALNKRTDETTIFLQASIFNGSARVFAPRYRQAHIKAYFAPNSQQSIDAFNLAYNDLKTAFQYYLDHWNHGRPIIIAGHSQGSMHAVRLLKEFFDGKPLQKKLVCAYIPGWNIKASDFKNIPLGVTPSQTGCVLTWRSFKKGATDGRAQKNDDSWCVNPISWTDNETWTTPDMHKGIVSRNFNTPIAHKVTASINKDQHILWVDGADDYAPSSSAATTQLLGASNLHVLDFNLFYMDVRENVKVRINSYLRR